MFYYTGRYSGITPTDMELYTPEDSYNNLLERVVIGSLGNPTKYLLKDDATGDLYGAIDSTDVPIRSVVFDGWGIYGISNNLIPHFPVASKTELQGFETNLIAFKIRGKRKFNTLIMNLPNIDFYYRKEENCIASIAINFVYEGNRYDGMQILYMEGGVFRSVRFLRDGGSLEIRDFTQMFGKEIDFGLLYQDIPEFMYNWIMGGTNEIPPEITRFNIILYQNRAEVNRVGKEPDWLDNVGTLSGTLRDECSLIAPSIVFEAATVPNFNYVHIPVFGRYYFVTGIDSVAKNLWRMRLNCDVLETYKNQIWALTAVIDRQENDYNPQLNDPNVPAEVNDYVELYEFENTAGAGFDVRGSSDAGDLHFIVTTVGGGE